MTGGVMGVAGTAVGGQSTAPSALEYFISPTGLDSNPGTQELPLQTLERGLALANENTTIWLMAGTFPVGASQVLRQSGTPETPIRLWAVAGERPLLDYTTQARGSGSRGLEIKGSFWHMRGFELMNAGDNGIAISGSWNVIEDVVLHGNADSGLQITVSEADAASPVLGANNLVLNCDSYENIDIATGGENADGFAAKLRIGPGNVFRGCRAWNNADDGWDMFAADDVVVIEDCWAFSNGKAVSGANPAGDGNGFKLGGTPNGPGQGHAAHQLSRVAAFDNRTCGFTRNNNAQSPTLSDCAVAGNDRDYCSDLVACTPERSVATTAAAAKALARNADGGLPELP